MPRIFLSLLLIGLLLFCFSQDTLKSNTTAQQLKEYHAAEKIYQHAEHLSLQAGDDESLQAKADEVYQQALTAFENLITAAEKAGNDSLAFLTRLRTGFINYYLNKPGPALKDYLAAIALKQKLTSVSDSFLFIPLLYTGGIYYSQNQFDSALVFYKKAEQVNDGSTKPLNESQRLYNRLGVMYYETSNYRQARNYFEKAIAVLTATDPSNKNLLANYKINIASLLVKLEELQQAQSVYESILPYNIFSDEIYHNLAIISLKQQNYKKAISYLRKVNYSDSKKIIDLYYNLGMAWYGLNDMDSSEFYIQKALAENVKWNGRNKNVTHGLILKYQAEELTSRLDYSNALIKYQQAIIQLVNDFNTTDIYKNPGQYSGVFSYINLFNLLTAKGDAFEKLYQKGKDIKELEASLDAYRSAFRLADYVERTYDSDEARLFLNKIKYTAHSKPIDVSLLLFDLTQKRGFLEDAYLFDQRNKASILSLNIQENEERNKSGTNNELFLQESSAKSAITRLSLKASQTTDSASLAGLNASIRDYEIQLGKLQEKLKSDPAYRQKQLSERIPAVNDLQKKLDNTTALLSYHLSEDRLLILFISAGKFEYYSSAISKDLFLQIDSFKTSLQAKSEDQKYNGSLVSMSLYQKLIAPVGTKLSQIDRLIIIPDDELNYLPFEALQDEKRQYLIQKFSVQYQYSTAMFEKKDRDHIKTTTLAFAPFISKSYTDSTGFTLSNLPASKEEVNKLAGDIFTDSAATKQHFLQSADHYGIIHLATHASVSNEMPLRSYIAFYPGNNPNDYRLYAGEIYNMNLDSTQLIILSACETGTGKLVKGEGLMSLSRAFAYAGCPNIITSLWKAEDKTTAFISQRLHIYLQKGFGKDIALQRAKLDLLNSNDIDPRFKTPDYWAHLVFIGQYEPAKPSDNWWWLAIGILVFSVIVIITTKRKRIKA